MNIRPQIVIVAAVARNGVIGGGNTLLWRLSSDLKRFKALTWGKPLVMGRKTYESIGRPLPGRETILVTRDASFRPEGVLVRHDLESALALAHQRAEAMGADAIVIAGGGDIYAQTIDRADRLDITHVDLDPKGDTVFPRIDPGKWSVVSREEHAKGPADDATFRYCVYELRRNGCGDVEKPSKGA